jgi:hypothetical protein
MSDHRQRIREIQEQFTVLAGWDIRYDDRDKYKGLAPSCPFPQVANIRAWAPVVEGADVAEPEEYLLNAMLHIAIRAVGDDREQEELLVQDLCRLLTSEERRRGLFARV